MNSWPILTVLLAAVFAAALGRPRTTKRVCKPGCRRVIVDVDAGLDDIFALLMVMSEPNLEIMAITCSNGNTHAENVTDNVKRVLTLLAITDIPIYTNSDDQFTPNPPINESDHYFGYDAFANISTKYPVGKGFPKQNKTGDQILVELANAYPGQIELLILTPPTIMGFALKRDPNFATKLKAIYVMGGNYKGLGNVRAGSEFNFAFDPLAAYELMTKPSAPVILIGWETLLDNQIPFKDIQKWLACESPVTGLMRDFIAYLNRNNPTQPLLVGDGVAAMALLNPLLITNSYTRRCSVELDGTNTIGQLLQATQDYHFPELKKESTIVELLDMQKAINTLFLRTTCGKWSPERPKCHS